MNRRTLLGALLALPFAPSLLRAVVKVAPASLGNNRLDPAGMSAILKEFYSGQIIENRVDSDGHFFHILEGRAGGGDYSHPCRACFTRDVADLKARLLEKYRPERKAA